MTAEVTFGGDSTDIPAGTYPATLKSIEVKESPAYGQFRAWDFTLENGSVVGGASSMSMNAKSKGGRWAVAIAGRPLEKGVPVDLGGCQCLVVIEEDANGWPKVVNVVPAPTGRPETAVQPVPALQAVQPAPLPQKASEAVPDDLPF